MSSKGKLMGEVFKSLEAPTVGLSGANPVSKTESTVNPVLGLLGVTQGMSD